MVCRLFVPHTKWKTVAWVGIFALDMAITAFSYDNGTVNTRRDLQISNHKWNIHEGNIIHKGIILVMSVLYWNNRDAFKKVRSVRLVKRMES